jgi:hypothetical protein
MLEHQVPRPTKRTPREAFQQAHSLTIQAEDHFQYLFRLIRLHPTQTHPRIITCKSNLCHFRLDPSYALHSIRSPRSPHLSPYSAYLSNIHIIPSLYRPQILQARISFRPDLSAFTRTLHIFLIESSALTRLGTDRLRVGLTESSGL